MHIGIDARMMGKDVRGIGRYVERLLAHLAVMDTENRYTVFTRPSSVHLVPASMKTVITNIKWYGLNEQWTLPDIFENQGLDLLHVPHWNAPVRVRVPLIMTIHDMILWEHPTLGATTLSPVRYALKYLGYRYTVKRNVRRARRILAVSESARTALFRTLTVAPEKVAVTPLGLDPLITGNLPISVQTPYVLSVGSGYPHKNLPTFFRVCAKIFKDDPRLTAVIVGSDPAFVDRLKTKAQKTLGTHFDRIQFLGVAPDDTLGALYRNANALIFTSLDEGFGLPPLEAILAGIPVVASNINTTRETLGRAIPLVHPFDVDGYVHAYHKIMTDNAYKTAVLAAAKARVDEWTWERTARTTLAAYRDAFSTA